MEKENKLDSKTLGILIIIGVILVSLLVYVLTNYSKNNVKEEETTSEIEETPTTNRLKNHLNDIKNPISFVVLKEANVTKNQNGDTLLLKKNVNLLASEENKQLLAMEYILKDLGNNKNFVVLKDNKEVTGEKNPLETGTLAYYPYNDYNIIYKKLFNKDLDITTKKISTQNNQYDKSKDFVYYNNSRSSTDLLIDSFTVETTNHDEITNKYTASVSMKYNEALATKVGSPTDEVEVIYSLANNEIIIESFMIK